jgi:hypothetical protein
MLGVIFFAVVPFSDLAKIKVLNDQHIWKLGEICVALFPVLSWSQCWFVGYGLRMTFSM